MKIGIVAFPRTSSTDLVHRIGRSLNIPIHEEPLTILHEFHEKYDFVHTTLNRATTGVFKFMGHNFFGLSWQAINWKSFDRLIFVERHDIAMACMSTYIARTNNVWQNWHDKPHREVYGGDVPHKFVTDFLGGLAQYFEVKKNIMELCESIEINYEDPNKYSVVAEYLGFTNIPIPGPYEPTGLDYHTLCSNYEQVNEWVKLHQSTDKLNN